MKKIKKIAPKILLGSSIAFISPDTFLGGISGYFITKFFSGKKTGEPGIIKSLIFNIRHYRFHFHHWLIGLVILTYAFLSNSFSLSYFSFGLVGGLIFQGIYSYSDWKKVILKQKPA